ncbi:hypothetical protein CCR75_003722 [Bremia lactucae]|uniref:Uncharacterized protein n=1 Tax=Bremia lactucae TaxID=4779 RepID=A0A976NZ97_BRELC|nr:hypothetical protein CCR75_003722 [Bremia lactucae]
MDFGSNGPVALLTIQVRLFGDRGVQLQFANFAKVVANGRVARCVRALPVGGNSREDAVKWLQKHTELLGHSNLPLRLGSLRSRLGSEMFPLLLGPVRGGVPSRHERRRQLPPWLPLAHCLDPSPTRKDTPIPEIDAGIRDVNGRENHK